MLEDRRIISTITSHLSKILDSAFEADAASSKKVFAFAKRLVKTSFARVTGASLSDHYKVEGKLTVIQSVMKLSKTLGLALAELLEEETRKSDIIKSSCLSHVLGLGLLGFPASPAERVCLNGPYISHFNNPATNVQESQTPGIQNIFLSLQNYPRCSFTDIQQVYQTTRRTLSFAVDVLHQSFLQVLRAGKKDALCGWIGAAVELCAKLGVKSRSRDATGPNFAVNLVALLVKMAKKLGESKFAVQHEYVWSAKGERVRGARSLIKGRFF